MKPAIYLGQVLPALALTARQEAAPFTNPVIYSDFADNDVSLGPDGAYYFSASNMHYSPGAPVLRSLDLVNWELIGHSVPHLNFGEDYDLNGGQAYRGGTWASSMRYRESTGLWYWVGCVNFWETYIYTAEKPEGPWEKASVLEGGTCYYDCGLLIDEDDTMYVVYGATDVKMAQLSEDGMSEVRSEDLFRAEDVGLDGIEGNRLYKKDGLYYILNDHPGTSTYIWKSESPWGPWESKVMVDNVASPVEGGGTPHQGSLIQATTGDWYFMSFTWAYPAGRMPVLAPVEWAEDGYPVLVTDESGGWGASYPMPHEAQPLANWTGTDTFPGPDLGPEWEWNHNPDPTKYTVDNGLTLSTATVTDDLYAARNTLTHRTFGEFPNGTIHVDFASMSDGDFFGIAAFRDRSALIGVLRDGDAYKLRTIHNITQDEETWETIDPGTLDEEAEILDTEIWLRAALDVRAGGTREAAFDFSFDGERWQRFGRTYEMWTNWAYFMGYRFGIFNFATKELGGSVKVLSFTST